MDALTGQQQPGVNKILPLFLSFSWFGLAGWFLCLLLGLAWLGLAWLGFVSFACLLACLFVCLFVCFLFVAHIWTTKISIPAVEEPSKRPVIIVHSHDC